MKTKIKINPSYQHIRSLIEQIPYSFDNLGNLIFSERNQVRIIENDAIKIAVKSYHRPSFLKSCLFLFKKSKARKAYENALILTRKNIQTPFPIAYIECYQSGILINSYFISLYVEYPPLKDTLLLPSKESYEALIEFARFTYRLHQTGICHLDYHLKNVLLMRTPNGYDFCLIDNNRIKYGRVSKQMAMKSLDRIYLPVEKYGFFAGEYARLSENDEIRTLQGILFYHQIVVHNRKLKRALKSICKEKVCLDASPSHA